MRVFAVARVGDGVAAGYEEEFLTTDYTDGTDANRMVFSSNRQKLTQRRGDAEKKMHN